MPTFGQIISEGLDSLVEFSRVLGDSVTHFLFGAESADEDELIGHADACSSFVLGLRNRVLS